MLSPGIRQVIHALLTRPPLTHKSLGFNMSPFDLHVLSTPPAFILSQDQTLMLKFDSRTSKTGNRKHRFLFMIRCVFRRFYFFKGCVLFIGHVLWTILRHLNTMPLIRIFRVALLFICQSAFCCSCLTQLRYLITAQSFCQELFSLFLISCPLLFRSRISC